MTSDIINGFFEYSAGFFILLSVHQLYKDKAVKGFSVITILFFYVASVWNLYYYHDLNQPWSLNAALFVVVVNTIQLVLIFKYKDKKTCNNPTLSVS